VVHVTRPLLVYSPYVGKPSETFIRRHVRDLVPGGAAVATHDDTGPESDAWIQGVPLLDLRLAHRGLRRKVINRALRPLGFYAPELLLLRRFVHAQGTSVMIGEYLDASHRFLAYARRLDLRFVVHGHGYDVSRRLRDAAWRARYRDYATADTVVVPSALMRDRLVELGLAEAQVHVIPYGVDVPPLSRPAAEDDLVRCLAVGRLVAKKAPVLLIEAFARAADVLPQLVLEFVGDGPLRLDVERAVRDHGVADRVRLLGAAPNDKVLELMREADIFLQHSIVDVETGNEEGLPVSILEAMAHGVPVVATSHAGIPEAVVDGETGYLVAERDTGAMAERLIGLARDSELRRCLGAAGHVRAAARFSWPVTRPRLLAALGLPQE
jgi:colanic acid/amylovoran biosynthesis glycosyltransferase